MLRIIALHKEKEAKSNRGRESALGAIEARSEEPQRYDRELDSLKQRTLNWSIALVVVGSGVRVS